MGFMCIEWHEHIYNTQVAIHHGTNIKTGICRIIFNFLFPIKLKICLCCHLVIEHPLDMKVVRKINSENSENIFRSSENYEIFFFPMKIFFIPVIILIKKISFQWKLWKYFSFQWKFWIYWLQWKDIIYGDNIFRCCENWTYFSLPVNIVFTAVSSENMWYIP